MAENRIESAELSDIDITKPHISEIIVSRVLDLISNMGEQFNRIKHDDIQDLSVIDDQLPIISTLNHFDTTLYGRTYLTEGNSLSNYDFYGEKPVSPEELVVHVHGWRNGEKRHIKRLKQMTDLYRESGYEHPVIGLIWDSDHSWTNAKDIADLNALKLASFLIDYKQENPDTTIHLQGHSLGSRVVAETIYQLDQQEEHDLIDTVIFLAGAVNSDDIALDGRYGSAMESSVNNVENYWNPEDNVLNLLYKLSKHVAIGNNGCIGQSLSNYTDHEVEVNSHRAYYSNSEIIQDVVNTF